MIKNKPRHNKAVSVSYWYLLFVSEALHLNVVSFVINLKIKCSILCNKQENKRHTLWRMIEFPIFVFNITRKAGLFVGVCYKTIWRSSIVLQIIWMLYENPCAWILSSTDQVKISIVEHVRSARIYQIQWLILPECWWFIMDDPMTSHYFGTLAQVCVRL